MSTHHCKALTCIHELSSSNRKDAKICVGIEHLKKQIPNLVEQIGKLIEKYEKMKDKFYIILAVGVQMLIEKIHRLEDEFMAALNGGVIPLTTANSDEQSKAIRKPVITVYGADYTELLHLLRNLVGGGRFYIVQTHINLMTVLLTKMENLPDAHIAIKESLPNINIHTAETAFIFGNLRTNYKNEILKPALTLYGAWYRKVREALIDAVGEDEFYIDSKMENVFGLHLSFVVSVGKVRKALLERGYKIHTSDAFTPVRPICLQPTNFEIEINNIMEESKKLQAELAVIFYADQEKEVVEVDKQSTPSENCDTELDSDEQVKALQSPIITVYGVGFKELYNVILELVGQDNFYILRKPRNLTTVLLTKIENIFKAHKAIRKSGLNSQIHTAETEFTVGETISNSNNETFKQALTVYDAADGNVIREILINAVGKDEFLISKNREQILNIRLNVIADYHKVRTALLDRGYNIHTSDVFKVFRPEKTIAKSINNEDSQIEMPTVTNNNPEERPAITIYEADYNDIQNLLTILIGETEFSLKSKPRNLITIFLAKVTDIEIARHVLLQSEVPLNIHTAETPMNFKPNITNEFRTLLTLYGGDGILRKIVDILMSALGTEGFCTSTIEKNVLTLYLSNRSHFEKVRMALLDKGYKIHTSLMFKKLDECSQDDISVESNFSEDTKQGVKFQPALTLYNINCKKIKKIRNQLQQLLGPNEFFIDLKPKNCISIELSQLENVDMIFNVLCSKAYQVVKNKNIETMKINTTTSNVMKSPAENQIIEKPIEDACNTDSDDITANCEIPTSEDAGPSNKSNTSTSNESSVNMFEACTKRYGDNFMETFALLRQFAPEFNRISKEKGEDEAMKALQMKLLNVELS